MAGWNCSDEGISELRKLSDGVLRIEEDVNKYY